MYFNSKHWVLLILVVWYLWLIHWLWISTSISVTGIFFFFIEDNQWLFNQCTTVFEEVSWNDLDRLNNKFCYSSGWNWWYKDMSTNKTRWIYSLDFSVCPHSLAVWSTSPITLYHKMRYLILIFITLMTTAQWLII